MSTQKASTATVMKQGYLEIVGSHAASTRRSKNRNAEIALERITAALSTTSHEVLLAKGTSNTNGNGSSS